MTYYSIKYKPMGMEEIITCLTPGKNKKEAETELIEFHEKLYHENIRIVRNGRNKI